MANQSSTWLKAISNLNALTQKGALTWQAEIPLAPGDVEAFTTEYGGKRIRLRSRATKTQGFFTVEVAASLEVIDENGKVLYRVPETTGLNDLHQSVKYQLAGVDTLLNSLLKDPRI